MKSTNAVGYTRVSTEEQSRKGVSLATQRARIEAWAVAKGLELAKVCTDEGISGKRADNRPGLQEAMVLACEHGAPLVVVDFDRLSRSTVDALLIADDLRKCGAGLVSLSQDFDTTSPVGEVMFTVISAFAQFERRMIAQRTTAAMSHKKRQGKVYARVPLGYVRRGRDLVPDADELRTVQRIQTWSKKGWSMNRIARHLNTKKVPTKRGGKWYASTVRYVLKNDLYRRHP